MTKLPAARGYRAKAGARQAAVICDTHERRSLIDAPRQSNRQNFLRATIHAALTLIAAPQLSASGPRVARERSERGGGRSHGLEILDLVAVQDRLIGNRLGDVGFPGARLSSTGPSIPNCRAISRSAVRPARCPGVC